MSEVQGRDAARGTGVILVNRFRPDPLVVLLEAPHSAAAEEYRKVLAGGLGPGEGASAGTLAVVSALPGEGKSLTAVNLALALAEHFPRKVLLVDFDLRRPSLEGFLVEKRRRGLADVLSGTVKLEEAIQNCAREKLSVVTAGWKRETAAQELEPRVVSRLLGRLRERFEIVVADCPPLLPFAESRHLARVAEHVLLVARAEVTPRSALQEAVELVDPDRLIGVLLNAMPARRWERYGYRYAYRWREEGETE